MADTIIALLSLHSSPLGRLGERDTGGMSVFLLETSIGLAGKGYDVDIFTLEGGRTEAKALQLAKNVRLISLPYPWGETVIKEEIHTHLDGVFTEFCHFNRRDGRRYSLVHSHYWLSACIGRLIAEECRIPHLVSFHTVGAIKNDACAEEEEPRLRLESERMLAVECDRLIVFTKADRRRLAALFGLEETAIGVVPCGVNLRRFKPVPKQQARKRLGIGKDASVLLAVGRYVPIKGMDRLLEAAAALARKRRVLLLLAGGDGPRSAQFRDVGEKAAALGIERYVRQAGLVAQEDLPVYYSAADLFLVGSYYESFCLTALEALACGTPVVGSAVGCLPEIVGPGAGMVLDRPTGPDLAAAVEDVLHRISEKRLPPSRLRELAFSYSWDRSVEALDKQYGELLQGAGGRRVE